VVSASLAAAELGELGTPSELPTDPALRGAASFLIRHARAKAFLDEYVLPLLEEAEGAAEWYVAHSYEGTNGSYSLQVFVWPTGTGTRIHDHSCWGAYCCAVRSVHEETTRLRNFVLTIFASGTARRSYEHPPEPRRGRRRV
jgi:hypothetical protein